MAISVELFITNAKQKKEGERELFFLFESEILFTIRFHSFKGMSQRDHDSLLFIRLVCMGVFYPHAFSVFSHFEDIADIIQSSCKPATLMKQLFENKDRHVDIFA